MSHFSVLVIGVGVEKQLAPYHEFECTGTDDEYVQDLDVTAEIRVEYAQHDSPEAMTFLEYLTEYEERKIVPYGEEPDLEDEHKYGYVLVDADGNVERVIWRSNPDAKWDWWVIGGRWRGYFLAKPGVDVVVGDLSSHERVFGERPTDRWATDQIRKGDIDFEEMARRARTKAESSYDEFLKAGANHSWIYGVRMKPEAQARLLEINDFETRRESARALGFDAYESREEYVERRVASNLVPFAVVKDGKWYEKGEMGWWGMARNEMGDDEWNARVLEMIEGLDDDTVITAVDCHI